MTPVSLPSVFVSHGAPTLAIEPGGAGLHIPECGLGQRYPGVAAVLCISAHWNTARPTVNAVTAPKTIHDFSGFPEELYGISYPVPGAPDLARRVAGLIGTAGHRPAIPIPAGVSITGHGFPSGRCFPGPASRSSSSPSRAISTRPVTSRSGKHLPPSGARACSSSGAAGLSTRWATLAFALGEEFPTDRRAIAFNEWLNRAVTSGDKNSLVHYRELAPSAVHAQPYPDHFMPLLTALGAAGPGATGSVLHQSWYWGNLGMGAYEFRERSASRTIANAKKQTRNNERKSGPEGI